MATAAACVAPVRVAVLGAGVAGSMVVHTLQKQIAAGLVSATVFEIGRGPGGRAATRTSRDNPYLRIDHGAPAFVARSQSFQNLCEHMCALGILEHATAGKYGVLTETGNYVADGGPEGGGKRYIGGKQGLGGLSDALLRGGDLNAHPLVKCQFSTMVRGITPVLSGDLLEGWRLHSSDGILGDFTWLVISSSTIAHPRWTQVFGGEPPLAAAASQLNDSALLAAVSEIAKVRAQPCIVTLLAFSGAAAQAWAAIPFSRARLEGAKVLRRVVVQRVNETLTTVVLHSTTEFAEAGMGVYGSKSAAAQVGGAASDPSREPELSQALIDEMETRLVPNFLAPEHVVPSWGPHLHRWGSAFPNQPHLPQEFAHAPDARVIFCGDFIAGSYAESVEGAAVSGHAAAEAIKAHLPPMT